MISDHAARAACEPRARLWVRRAPTLLVAAIAAVPLTVFLYVALSRLNYPLDLEWLEGYCMNEARQFALDRPLFAAPTAQYMATPYFPLYLILTGLIYKATGVVYWVGRLLSLLATLATGAVALVAIRRATKQVAMGLLAAGIWFAAYGYSGFFYDLNRVDVFATFLLVAAYAAAFFRLGFLPGATAGLLLAASAWTKQNHAAFVAPMLFAQLMRKDFRGAAALFVVFATAFGGLLLLCDRASGGWLYRLTIHMVPVIILRDRWVGIATLYARHFAAAAALILAYVGLCAARGRWRELLGDPWLGFWASSVALAVVFQLTPGGWINHNTLPALGTSLGVAAVLPPLAAWLREKIPWLNRPATLWLLPLLAATLVFSAYSSPKGQIPSHAQWNAARQLHEFVRVQPGPVFIVDLILFEPNIVPFNYMSYRDLIKAVGQNPWKRDALAKIQDELRHARPAAILSAGDLHDERDYRGLVADANHAILPHELQVAVVTGKATMLRHLYWSKDGVNPLTVYAGQKPVAVAN